MDTQTQAQIYLAGQRGSSSLLNTLRSFHCFNFGSYVDESRQPFGNLRLLNDDFLTAGGNVSLDVGSNTDVILIPLVGGLEYETPVGHGFAEPGQAQLLSLAQGMAYQVINPYETEQINYLTIWLTNSSNDFTPKTALQIFNLETKNKLLPFYQASEEKPADSLSRSGWIGRYDGRQDGVYRLINKSTSGQGVFVFVLSGAFEVQNRLLHERDGLALTDIQHNEVDFEALSNEAVLVLLNV